MTGRSSGHQTKNGDTQVHGFLQTGVTKFGFMTGVSCVGRTKTEQQANYELAAATLHQAEEVFKMFMKRHSISSNLYRAAFSASGLCSILLFHGFDITQAF
jgi:hypothetical protein